MPTILPELLATITQGKWVRGMPAQVTGVSIDTRTLKAGDLFVALQSGRDGHDYLTDALIKGASAALVTREISTAAMPQLVVDDTFKALHRLARAHREAFSGKVVGITGSCGKTSTKELMALLLGETGVHRTYANLNNQLGVPLTLLGMDTAMHRVAVVEAGMNQLGEIAVLGDMIRPDVGIVTMVGAAHLEGLGNLDNVAREKADLLYAVASDGLCLFPESCLNYSYFKNLDKKAIILSHSNTEAMMSEKGEVIRFSVVQEQEKMILKLAGKNDAVRQFEMPLASPGMAQNAALALLAASHLGVSDSHLQLRLRRWSPVAFRGQIMKGEQLSFYVDCYNANPASMQDTLVAFRNTFPRVPKLYVLGSMNELGGEAAALHGQVGRSVHLSSDDSALLIGPHAEAIKEGMLEAGNSAAHVRTFATAEEVAPLVKTFSGAVLLKGSRSYHLEMLLPDDLRQAPMPIHHYRMAMKKEALC